jgi:metal-responsive CopG/Arc/MetJ family transcriptional regulator
MTYHHTMPKTKIAITIDEAVLAGLDALVKRGRYPNRSRAFEAAAQAELARTRRTRLAEACAELYPAEERALADEGLAADTAAWPAY